METETFDGVNGECRLIPLTQGKFAIVDAEDYDRLSRHKWYACGPEGYRYACRSENGKKIKMHREIVDVPAGMVCDHRNHSRLDNRRCNLRVCTPSQNAQNRRPQPGGTSRYKGVYWHKDARKWRARIQYKGRLIHIGCYDYEADAAIAYDDMAIELFGEFACLNFQYRPEIREWLRQTFFFTPTRNDPAGFEPAVLPVCPAPCHAERSNAEKAFSPERSRRGSIWATNAACNIRGEKSYISLIR
jgi:hypothetical protein